MKALSKLVEIPNSKQISTEYIEKFLTKLNINPIRWAIISVSDTIITLSVSYVVKTEG